MRHAFVRQPAFEQRERVEPQRDRPLHRTAVRRLPDRIVRQPRERHVRAERRRSAGTPSSRSFVDSAAFNAAHAGSAASSATISRAGGLRPPRDPFDRHQRQCAAASAGRHAASASQHARSIAPTNASVTCSCAGSGRRAPRVTGNAQRVARCRIGHQRDEHAQPVAVHDSLATARARAPDQLRPDAAAGAMLAHTSVGSTFATGIVLRVNTGSATPAARWRR